MDIRSLHEHELDAWFNLCGSIFSVGPDYFRRHWGADPWRKLDGIIVCVDGDALVGSVRVFHRRVWLDGRQVSVGGIGEVCTLPDYRGKGISHALLSMAVSYMRQQNMAFSMLFCSLFDHYAKHGFVRVPLRRRKAEISSLSPTPSEYEIVPYTPDHINAVRMLYDASTPSLNGPIVRNHADYWHNWVLSEWKKLFVIMRSGNPVAYAELEPSADGGEVSLREFAFLPDHARAISSSLPKLALATSPAATHISAPSDIMPNGLPLAHIGGMMVALLNPIETAETTLATSEALADYMAPACFFRPDSF